MSSCHDTFHRLSKLLQLVWMSVFIVVVVPNLGRYICFRTSQVWIAVVVGGMGGPSQLVFSGGRARTCWSGGIRDQRLSVFEFYGDSAMTLPCVGIHPGNMPFLSILGRIDAGMAFDISMSRFLIFWLSAPTPWDAPGQYYVAIFGHDESRMARSRESRCWSCHHASRCQRL